MNLLHKLARLSGAGQSQTDLGQRVFATNLICWIGIVATILFSVVQGFNGLVSIVMYNQISTLTFAAVLYASYRKKFVLSRCILLSYINLCLTVYSYLFGTGIGLNLLFFTTIPLPFLAFLPRERIAIVATSAFGIACAVLVELYGAAWRQPVVDLGPEVVRIMQRIYWCLALISFLGPPIFLFTQNNRYESLLQAQQAKLLQATKMASLGEMAAGIAHEVNNPLAVINGYVNKLQTKGDALSTTERNEIYSRMIQTVGRIHHIVRSMLIFSRENGELEFRESFDVRTLVENTLIFCRERFEKRGVQLQIEETNDQLSIYGDRTILSQALLNLLHNAYDATSKCDHPTISIVVEKAGDFVQISVLDNGPGVDEKVRSKLGLPFITTKAPGQGTGLGLSVSMGILRSQGGRLFLAEDSKQTKFTMSIPAANAVKKAA